MGSHSAGVVDHADRRTLPRRLLGVWAHPDDECYLSAGLMARVVAAGGHVRLVCATRGEHGTSDPALAGTARLAAAREAELRASLSILGVHDLHFLELPDGGCDRADDAGMAAIVARHLGAIDADTVVTFGPDGMTGHSDHLAVCRWSTRAARARTEVLYAAVTDEFAERHRGLHDRLGLFADRPGGRPDAVPASDLALRVRLDHVELVRKRNALRAHGSQTDALAELVGEDTYFGWWRDECFRHPTPSERRGADPVVGARPIEVGS
jgi:LmbE family N-acetylglucosaminyl deacetylase